MSSNILKESVEEIMYHSTKKRASRASELRADGVPHTRGLIFTHPISCNSWTRPQIPLGASPPPYDPIIS